MSWQILNGDCIDLLRELDDNSIDAAVTDPPYGIGFMSHPWDQPGVAHAAGPGAFVQPPAPGRTAGRSSGSMEAGKYDLRPTANRAFQAWCETWAAEVLRVLKPGGHLVSFGGTRTYHRLVAGIEDAGFEIRDQLAWLFGSGFPKSRNLGDGRGTALKPAHEPIVLARKPMVGSAGANVELHGTGGLNIDVCKIPIADVVEYERNCSGDRGHEGTRSIEERGATDMRMGGGSAAGARWPANVVLDEEAAQVLDEQTGVLTSGANPTRRGSDKFRDVYGDFAGQAECEPQRGLDRGGASRFFYCAKASRQERNAGLGPEFTAQSLNWSSGDQSPGTFQSQGTDRTARNPHPTVKPVELMRWLCRLVTPPGGAIVDPFTGSGTTGIAAVLEGFEFVGIEREPDYVAVATERIEHWARHRPVQLDLLGDLA